MTNQEFIAYAMRRAAEYDPRENEFVKIYQDLPATAAETGAPPKLRRTAFFRVKLINGTDPENRTWQDFPFFVWELYRIEVYIPNHIERAGEGAKKC